jgi:RNA polymerase sigma factor (sigma-70 family)
LTQTTPEGQSSANGAPDLVEHFFRREYGRLVAILTRTVGLRHLEIVEDAVQSAMMTALRSWADQGAPDDPGAWLYRVAYNSLIDDLRRKDDRSRILAQAVDPIGQDAHALPASFFAREVADDTLRMLFICCDAAIPRESQLVFALKTLCGFSVSEIALRLFTSEANVYKRFARARDRLRDIAPEIETPSLDALTSRLSAVQAVLYLLFNEGYLSSHAEDSIRRELCDEAVRLTTLLAEHPIGARSDTFALLALMHLHAARLGARRDATGGLLLLEEQDRSLWDRERMRIGAEWLQRSANGDVFTRFHAEAGIAAEHCFAPSFKETRWQEIADLYAMLERIEPSPLHTMNRAVAVAESAGADAGLAVLQAVAPPTWLAGSYLWDAVMGDLHRRAGHLEIAQRHRDRALASAPSDAVRDLLRRRLTTAA